jgi:calcium-dependent protein kinase
MDFQIIAELLSGDEVDGLKNMFSVMDTNNTGVISIEQFKKGLQNLGSQLAENDIQQLVDAVSIYCMIPFL